MGQRELLDSAAAPRLFACQADVRAEVESFNGSDFP